MPGYAMRLGLPGRVSFGMAGSADRLHVVVMLGLVTLVMVIFMTALTIRPDVPTVYAGQRVGMRETACPYQHIDSLPRLFLVTITGR